MYGILPFICLLACLFLLQACRRAIDTWLLFFSRSSWETVAWFSNPKWKIFLVGRHSFPILCIKDDRAGSHIRQDTFQSKLALKELIGSDWSTAGENGCIVNCSPLGIWAVAVIQIQNRPNSISVDAWGALSPSKCPTSTGETVRSLSRSISASPCSLKRKSLILFIHMLIWYTAMVYHRLCWFAGASTTKYHRLRGLNNWNFFSRSSGG